MRAVKHLLILTSVLVSGIASARVDVFVHGRNSGTADVSNYWLTSPSSSWPGASVNGGAGDGAWAMTGNGTEGSYAYGYDASKSWSNLSANSMPVCALTQAMYNAPGTDMAVIGHSAGGLVAMYMLSVAQNGWATSCSTSPASAKSWTTYVITIAAPLHGTEVADAIYGNTSGNWAQYACGKAAGFFANLLFNQASDMTWACQKSYLDSWYGSLTAYGTFGAIYENGGTSTNGDDSTGLRWAQWCANVEGGGGWGFVSPNAPNNNDGFISKNSALGCARGSSQAGNPGGSIGVRISGAVPTHCPSVM